MAGFQDVPKNENLLYQYALLTSTGRVTPINLRYFGSKLQGIFCGTVPVQVIEVGKHFMVLTDIAAPVVYEWNVILAAEAGYIHKETFLPCVVGGYILRGVSH